MLSITSNHGIRSREQKTCRDVVPSCRTLIWSASARLRMGALPGFPHDAKHLLPNQCGTPRCPDIAWLTRVDNARLSLPNGALHKPTPLPCSTHTDNSRLLDTDRDGQEQASTKTGLAVAAFDRENVALRR